jgi:hypothetical protein
MMKQIPLKCLNEQCDYRRTIIAFLTIPLEPGQGATYDEVMETALLLQKAHDANDVLEVTEEEHAVIVARFKNGRYKEISMDTYTMLKDITDA